jgi:hypothetical protein
MALAAPPEREPPHVDTVGVAKSKLTPVSAVEGPRYRPPLEHHQLTAGNGAGVGKLVPGIIDTRNVA